MRRHTEDRVVRSRHGETVDHEGSYAIVTFGAFAVPAVSSSPIAVLSRQLAPLGGVVAPLARGGLLEVLESVPDPRKKRGVLNGIDSEVLMARRRLVAAGFTPSTVTVGRDC